MLHAATTRVIFGELVRRTWPLILSLVSRALSTCHCAWWNQAFVLTSNEAAGVWGCQHLLARRSTPRKTSTHSTQTPRHVESARSLSESPSLLRGEGVEGVRLGVPLCLNNKCSTGSSSIHWAKDSVACLHFGWLLFPSWFELIQLSVRSKDSMDPIWPDCPCLREKQNDVKNRLGWFIVLRGGKGSGLE